MGGNDGDKEEKEEKDEKEGDLDKEKL